MHFELYEERNWVVLRIDTVIFHKDRSFNMVQKEMLVLNELLERLLEFW